MRRPSERRDQPYIARTRRSLILWTVACLGLGMTAELLGLLDGLELRTYDVRAQSRGQRGRTVSQELAVVAIDRASEDAMGPFPWPRGAYLSVALALERIGAKAALFVLDFRRPDSQASPWDATALPLYIVSPYTRVLERPRHEPPWVDEQAPVPSDIAAATPATSFSVLPASHIDGVHRHLQALVRYGRDRRPMDSLEARFVADILGVEPASLELPVDRRGRLLLAAGAADVPEVSFVQVLSGEDGNENARAAVEGRWVVVGVRSREYSELVRTPFGLRTPLDLRVAAINAMVTGKLLKPRTAAGVMVAFVAWAVLLAATCYWIAYRMPRPWVLAAIGFSGVLAHIAVAGLLFEVRDTWVPVAGPGLALLSATLAWIFLVGGARVRVAERRALRSEREAAFGVMSAQMRHEIRNLLNSIASPAAVIRRNFADGDPLGLRDRPEEICSEMDTIATRTRELSEMVERELSFLQPESFRWAAGDVWQCVTDALDVLGDELQKAGVDVQTHAPNDRAPTHLDVEKMRIVFVNLIRNAMQAMPDGGILSLTYDEPRRLLRARTARVQVADTGLGMDPDQLAHLFEPFYTTKARGLGLGLLNVKHIVDAHDGRIEALSHKGSGSSFTLVLPIATRNVPDRTM